MASRRALLKVVWEQNRFLLISVVALLLACAGFYFAEDRFVDVKLERLRFEQATLHQQLRQQQQRVAREGAPLSSAERMVNDLAEFNERIPTKIKFADFVGDLFAWADKVDLNIKQVNYQPKIKSDTGFLEYGLSFSVEGTYTQLKKFIHLLENSSRILIVDSINLSGRPVSDAGKSEVALTIKLTTYFQEERQ
ncbi:MAG TPA: type 4a pilus biogenesis protein PilO [Malonomonas sp.]